MDGSSTASRPEYLDPLAIPEGIDEWVVNFDVPSEVREFGYYPNIERLLPGDLILTSHPDPDYISRLIRKFQSGGDGKWTHVAMYMGGRGQIVEATFDGLLDRKNGVKVGNLSDYFTTHQVMVRRIPDAWLCGPGASTEECTAVRWQLVVSAMKEMRRPYGFWQLFGFLRKASFGIRVATKRKGLVCSTLYESAVADAIGRILINGDGSVTPAALAQTPTLDTVSVPWRKIKNKIPL
ncbi:hypothetical protein XaraCFBP7407_18655 [Xanthomonas arboricola pv. arracaciae]|uniref:hypothetical protein n=1 Tax=Xanthomonas arboricola TaxID=56448 RepID=UPI000CED92C3|nr:hypothetical protein [Xanthomonas arboricola]PPT93300.1 hypothetical protein XaraCFBP7407_18655 [Xanthomonas arboricola pv. arracaciae]